MLRTTERLLLRDITLNDIDSIFDIRKNVENWRLVDSKPYESRERTERFVHSVIEDTASGEIYFKVICEKETSNVIGTICLWSFSEEKTRAEIGYEIAQCKQGRGYANQLILDSEDGPDMKLYQLHVK